MLGLDNSCLAACAIATTQRVLKIMGQGWATVGQMMSSNAGMRSPGLLRPGPANRHAAPEQLGPNDVVERSRRMHRNDLENVPAFLAEGLLFAPDTSGLTRRSKATRPARPSAPSGP